jgi:hypothetical protein
LDGKTGKYTDFDFAKIKPDFLDAQGATLCGPRARDKFMYIFTAKFTAYCR